MIHDSWHHDKLLWIQRFLDSLVDECLFVWGWVVLGGGSKQRETLYMTSIITKRLNCKLYIYDGGYLLWECLPAVTNINIFFQKTDSILLIYYDT